MDQASPARRSFWRFSLRELLLLMLAAGAVIGWGTVLYRSQQLKPTAFFTDTDAWEREVIAIHQELGGQALRYAPVVTMHSDGSASVQRTMMFRIPLGADKREAFATALQKRAREKLSKSGCRRSGEAGGSGDHSNHAILGYTSDRVSGTVQICAISADDGVTVVVVTVHEQRGGGGSFEVVSSGD